MDLTEQLKRIQHDLMAERQQIRTSLTKACVQWRDKTSQRFERDRIIPLETGISRLTDALDPLIAKMDRAIEFLQSIDVWPDLFPEMKDAEMQARVSGQMRSAFARDFGHFAEEQVWKRMEEEKRSGSGGGDAALETNVVLSDPELGRVQYDCVDRKEHVIVDIKSLKPGQSLLDLQSDPRIRDQRRRHIQMYVKRYGVVPAYEYQTYPSTVSLFGGEGGESPAPPDGKVEPSRET